MNAYFDWIESPVGPIAFAANADGALLRLTFVRGARLSAFEKELERDGFTLVRDDPRAGQARRELLEYFSGARRSFDVPLALRGTPFQILVWQELLRIPFGQVRTYSQVARNIERPTAVRAVGRANATNRIPIVVPCHRVIGADRSLTGFGGGTDLKAWLLSHEAFQPGSTPPFLPLPLR